MSRIAKFIEIVSRLVLLRTGVEEEGFGLTTYGYRVSFRV